MNAYKYTQSGNDEMIASRIFIAGSFFQRLFGLIFKKPLKKGEALLIRDCKSIHTIGMKYNIDAFFIDENGKVLSVFIDMSPWSFTPYIGEARDVLELRSGLLRKGSISEGDRIIFIQ